MSWGGWGSKLAGLADVVARKIEVAQGVLDGTLESLKVERDKNCAPDEDEDEDSEDDAAPDDGAPYNGQRGALPWETRDAVRSLFSRDLMERVLDLSLDARAFTTPPPAGVDYSFNVSKRKAVVLKLLELDTELKRMHSRLGARTSEDAFWTSYFYKCAELRVRVGADKPFAGAERASDSLPQPARETPEASSERAPAARTAAAAVPLPSPPPPPQSTPELPPPPQVVPPPPKKAPLATAPRPTPPPLPSPPPTPPTPKPKPKPPPKLAPKALESEPCAKPQPPSGVKVSKETSPREVRVPTVEPPPRVLTPTSETSTDSAVMVRRDDESDGVIVDADDARQAPTRPNGKPTPHLTPLDDDDAALDAAVCAELDAALEEDFDADFDNDDELEAQIAAELAQED